VGVLSDSYDCAPGPFEPGARFTPASEDIRKGDLPSDVLMLKDFSTVPAVNCSDEGRAMMQLIHDVAPVSPLIPPNWCARFPASNTTSTATPSRHRSWSISATRT
jgi:hypothetical protein